MDKKKVSYVIFDFDGTLVDTESIHLKLWNDVVKYFDIKHDIDFSKSIGSTDITFVSEMRKQFDLPENIIQKKDEMFSKFLPSDFKPYKTVIETLKKLKRLYIPTAIASNGTNQYIKEFSSYGGVDIYIDFFCGFERKLGMKEKPAPDVYLNAIKALNADVSKTIAIEDTYIGIEAAKNAGICTLGVLNTHKRNELSNADALIEKMEDIFDFCDFIKH